MQEKTAKKYGFYMCLCMVIGTVVGTGIFFKNEGVYGLVNGNGYLGIIAWIIGGLTALCFGLSFMEIASAKQDSNSGIALYAKIFGGKKLGSVVRNAINNIYLPLTLFTVAYYCGRASIWAFGGGMEAEDILKENIGNGNYQFLLSAFAVIYSFLLISCSIYSENAGKWIQMITVVLKLFPLFFIGLVGQFIINPDAGAFSKEGLGNIKEYKDLIKNKGNFEMLLMALPGILFAFDGFLSTTFIQKDVKDAEKTIPLSLIIGLTSITIIYILVSIGTLNLDPSGSVAISVTRIFEDYPITKAVFSRIIFFFILISAIGTLNGYSFAFTKITGCSLEDGFVLGNKFWNNIINKKGIKFTNWIVTLLILLFWVIWMALPTIFTSMNFFEFISNSGVVMAFVMYGLIIFFGLLNRYQKKIQTKKLWYFIPAAIASIIGIILILGYNIYSYFANVFLSEDVGLAILQLLILILIMALPWTGLLMKENNTNCNNNDIIKEINITK